MSERSCDFWGITDNSQFNFHLQSYFLVFRSTVTRSGVFEEFWKDVRPLKRKQDVISSYEIRLSPLLMNERFEACVYFESTYSDVINTNKIALVKAARSLLRTRGSVNAFLEAYGNHRTLNKPHYFWREMIRRKAPFVKIELLKLNPNQQEIEGVLPEIQRVSSYPVTLIENHLRRIAPTALKICKRWSFARGDLWVGKTF